MPCSTGPPFVITNMYMELENNRAFKISQLSVSKQFSMVIVFFLWQKALIDHRIIKPAKANYMQCQIADTMTLG